MKITVFDVSNAACALVVCPKGYSMMIDCGSHSEKDCPVDLINAWKKTDWLSHMKDINGHPLTLLHISHPHDDHVRNSEKVKNNLAPYLLHRRRYEEFEEKPPTYRRKQIHQEYKAHLCTPYRGESINFTDWGFNTFSYQIPMDTLLSNDSLNGSVLNNSSILRVIELPGSTKTFRILFGGDMEEAGWDWLIANDANFRNRISAGVDILVASHHGHISGYSQNLMNLMGGAPKLSILSKGSESGGETDVDSRYSANSTGLYVRDINGNNPVKKFTLTTRSNGNIFTHVGADGIPSVWAQFL